MIKRLNKKKYNEEFGKTWMKCAFNLDVYFDYEKCGIIFKTKKAYKILITLILPLMMILQVISHGIPTLKECLINYIEFMKKDAYRTEWITSDKSWVYKGMCKVLEVNTLNNKYSRLINFSLFYYYYLNSEKIHKYI